MHDQDMYARTRSPDGQNDRTGSDRQTNSKVDAGMGTAKEAIANETKSVARTARREAGNVVGEARGQVRRLASDARDKARVRVRDQNDQLVERLRDYADELGEMAGAGNSPVRAAAGDLAARGRQVADYLADRGPEGLLSEVQSFARRRPLAFLAGALTAGFLVGRLGKSIYQAQADSDTGTGLGANHSRDNGFQDSRRDSGRSDVDVGFTPVPGSEPGMTGSAWETTPPVATTQQWTGPVAADPIAATPATPDVPPSQTPALYTSESYVEPDPVFGDEENGAGGRR